MIFPAGFAGFKEPHLDTQGRRLMRRRYDCAFGLRPKELAHNGCVILIATHDVELVAALATRTIFIADGDVVADGPTIDVLLSSPAFAPQVAKIMSPTRWLTVSDVVSAIYATR